MAIVTATRSEIGVSLEVDCAGDMRRAEVAPMPFHDRRKRIAIE